MKSISETTFGWSERTTPRLRRSWLTRLRVALTRPRDVLIVGINPQSQEFAARLPSVGYRVLGFVDGEEREVLLRHGRRLADVDSLADYLRHHVVDEVILALPSSAWSGPGKKACEVCIEQGITVRLLPHFMSPRLTTASVDRIHHHQVLTLARQIHPRRTLWAKISSRAEALG